VAEVLAQLEAVEKDYGSGRASVAALRGVDFSIERNDFVAIMGPSGSGKSTALHILGCLDVPSRGHYRFRGVDVAALSRDQRALLRRHYLGFVFQRFQLLPRSSALENVELPLLYRGAGARERHARAQQALEEVGLAARASHTPAELSGGEQQRVAIARAIAGEPLFLLADEPTGSLDSRSSRSVLELLTRLRRERGLAIALVTHDPAVASWAERVVEIEDGRVKQPPQRVGSA
jgi:putative ABC transport system ATP-binding protein